MELNGQPPVFMVPFGLTTNGHRVDAALTLTPGNLRALYEDIKAALSATESEPALVAPGLRAPETVALDGDDLEQVDAGGGSGARPDVASRDPRP
ncbi:hypothetical protein ACFVIM_05835 [Streptomyces sp. NPDC057638]|uniref:hypothetical protein n=1 Tax=Streptomyces sp. NPDC057638 TaxID=3346190 RepID=UPI0036B57307